jgi:hypothetical protein
MIRLFAGLLVAGSFCAYTAQAQVKVAAEQAHTRPISRSVQGEHGFSTSSAVINFSELAAAEAKSGKKASSTSKARAAMKAPKGLFVPGSGANSAEGQALAAASLTAAATANSPTTFTNFLGAPDNGNFIPPDTMGAIGTRQIMNTVNGEVRIQDRGGRVLSRVTLDGFWNRVGPFVSNGSFDPKVYFDAGKSRWITVACADAESSASSILIGVSKTDDALGQWNLYRIDADSADVYWADYPSVGQNSRWIVVSLNMFPNSPSGTYGGVFMWLFEKAELYNGPTTANFTKLAEPSGFTMAPATTFDPSEQNMYILETFSENSLRLSTITGPEGQETLNSGVATVPAPISWNILGGQIGQQLGTSLPIDCNDTRILSCVVRNGSVWASHSIFFPAQGLASRAAAQWWQVTQTGRVLQRGVIDDGVSSYAMPTLGVNKNNDMMIGYTRFNASIFATAAYSFRSAGDPLSTLQSEQILKAGEATYFKDFGSGENRWGDYSATMPDPLNDQDLWTVQEYAAASLGSESQWGTWWGALSLSKPPDNILEISVSPGDKSDVAAGQANDFFAVVTDSFLTINDATVTANIPGRAAVTFRNDGVAPDLVANDNIYSASITLNNSSESPIIFTATSPGKQPGSVTNTYNILPRPANDNFANAQKIPAGGIFGPTTAIVPNNFATSEPNEPLHAGVSNSRSLWWNYSTDTAGPILVDTAGSGADLVVAVYTGSALTTLLPVASTNPPPNKAAILKFNAQPGVTYRIAIAGADAGEKGTVRLRVQPNGEPDITPPIITIQFPPSGLVTNVPAITFRGTAIDPAPNASGVNSVLIHVLDIEPDTVIPATLIGNTWTANVPLLQPTNTFRVTGVDFANNTSAGQDIIVYYRQIQTTNDLFGFARPLPPPSGVDFASNTNASREFGEPIYGSNEGGKSLWWSYRPTQDGVLLVTTEGSDFDTLLGVFTVSDPTQHSLGALIPVGQNDEAADGTNGSSEVVVSVHAGQLYYIAVDGYAGASGTVRLEYDFAPTGVFDVTTSSSGGGTVSPTSATFPASSAVTVTATADRYMQFKQFRINSGGIESVYTNGPSYTFALNAPTSIIADFAPKQFTDDFQSGGLSKLPYQISSTRSFGQHWVVAPIETNSVTHESSLMARVAPGLPDSTAASLVLVTNLAAGTGSFEFRVNTETNYDKFEFSLDGRVLASWSGITNGLFTFTIPAKSAATRLEWRYVKDIATSADNELVAIDNLDLPITAPAPPAPINLGFTSSTTELTIVASGPVNSDFVLESSTDLRNWGAIADTERNSGPTGTVSYVQPLTSPVRFYRVRQL